MIITDILDHQWSCQCLGCSLANGEIEPPGGIIRDTGRFILHQDPEVPIKAFLIVASKKHLRSIAELKPDEARECFDLVYRARLAMGQVPGVQDVTLIQEERSAHFHLWMLPHYTWMAERFDGSLTSIRAMLEYARGNAKTVDNIQEILSTVDLLRQNIK